MLRFWIIVSINVLINLIASSIYSFVILSKSTTGTTAFFISAFTIIPFCILTAFTFFNIWANNDYNFYSQQDQEEEQQNIEKSCWEGMKPRTRDDKIMIIITRLNIFVLVVALILNTSLYQPMWVPWACFFWILIIEISLISLSKFYYSSYNYRSFWFIAGWIAIIVLWSCSLITFIIGAYEERDASNRRIITIILLSLHVIFLPGIFAFFAIYLPYRYYALEYEIGSTWHQTIRKWTLIGLTSGWSITLGVALMAFWKLYTSGVILIIFAVTLILLILISENKHLKTRAKWIISWTIMLILILIGYTGTVL